MLLVLLGTTFFAAGVISYGCDVASFPEEQHGLGRRLCNLERLLMIPASFCIRRFALYQETIEYYRKKLYLEDVTKYKHPDTSTPLLDLSDVDALKTAVEEMLLRTDQKLNMEPSMEKRKNEFIRFGKRSLQDVKRKNEFIRFGKRKNEFIRFGRFDSRLGDDAAVEKRKNEFIRFG